MRRADASVGDEQARRFEAEGYVVLPSLTSREEAAFMASVIDRLAQRAAMTETAGPLLQINMPALEAAELVDTRARANALAAARGLLGPGAVFTGEQAMIKPAGHAVVTPWHQDEAYWPADRRRRAVTIWLALCDVSPVNGCLHYIPGSHRAGLGPHRRVMYAGSAGAEMEARAVSEAGARLCPLRAGDAVVHDCRTLHGAGPNVSDRARVALAMGFADRVC